MIKREKFYRFIDEVIDQRITFGENEELDIPEITEMSAEQLAYLRDTIDSMRSDLSLLKSYVDQRIRGRLTGKAFRFGDRIYRGKNASKLVPYDTDKILEFLGDVFRLLGPVGKLLGGSWEALEASRVDFGSIFEGFSNSLSNI